VISPEKAIQNWKTPAWLKLSAFFLGILFFLWLPIEDTDEKRALAFAVALMGWFFVRYLVRLSPAVRISLPKHILVGTLAGLGITPAALFLMAFKTGLHGHGIPDFSADQIFSVINRTYFWGSAGLLLGLFSAYRFKMISNHQGPLCLLL
jgi:hypothetical protein